MNNFGIDGSISNFKTLKSSLKLDKLEESGFYTGNYCYDIICYVIYFEKESDNFLAVLEDKNQSVGNKTANNFIKFCKELSSNNSLVGFICYLQERLDEIFDQIGKQIISFHEHFLNIYKKRFEHLAHFYSKDRGNVTPLNNGIDEFKIGILDLIQNYQLLNDLGVEIKKKLVYQKNRISGITLSESKDSPNKMFQLIAFAANLADQTEIEFPEKYLTEFEHDIQAKKTEITSVIQTNFNDLKYYLVKIDFFLQCNWLVAMYNAIRVHPSPKIFKQIYLPPNSFEISDDKLEKIISAMGKDKIMAVGKAASVLTNFRQQMTLLFSDCFKTMEVESDIIKNFEEIQSDESGQRRNDKIRYEFPPEFSVYHGKTVSEIKKDIDLLAKEYETRNVEKGTENGNDDDSLLMEEGEEEEEEEENADE